ncbi:MAG: NAD(P)-dependent oxidoreductase [Anaerolineae bacterium]
MAGDFVVGMTADFVTQGLDYVEGWAREAFATVPGISLVWLPPMGRAVVAEEADHCDAILSLAIGYTAASFAGLKRLALISRWGVGYDMIDVAACTAAGVAIAITPNGVRAPVAEGAMTLTLALLKRLPEKDRAVRAGQWRGDIPDLGHSTSGIALGSVGLGNIGLEFMRMASGFHFRRRLAYDPFIAPDRAASLGIELVDLDTLLRESDVVAINCPLGERTYHLIGERELALMKPTAYLVNTARGPIVDQAALTRALREHRIAGAGLDVLEQEPPDPADPILALDNVILAPHAIAWGAEFARDLTTEACQACIDVSHGQPPRAIANRAVLESPAFQAKLARWGGAR